MRPDSPSVTVIIVNFNAGERLAKCLEHLARQNEDNFAILIVDNGSTDTSLEMATATGVAFEVIEAGENLGFAAANNRAAAGVDSEWLAFLNPDAYPEPGWLSALLDAAARNPDADAFGSTQIDATDTTILDGAGDAYHAAGVPYRGHFQWPLKDAPVEGACFSPCAAAALYRRSVFMALGGFEERFFCYGEDVDLGFKLRLAGGIAIHAAQARVAHEGSGVTGRRSAFTVYHGHRNRLWTYYLNMPASLLLATLPFHLAMNLALLVRHALTNSLGAYMRAMIDGVKGLPGLSADRRLRQRTRKASLGGIASALTWSPLKMARREADITPLPRKTP